MLYAFGEPPSPSFVLTEPQSGIGDTQLKFARLIGRDQGFVVQASVKLPTGDEDMLAGSGSSDWSVTLLRTRPLLARRRAAGYFWGVGSRARGDPQHIDFDAQTWVPTGIVGGSWQVLPKFGLKGQLDVHGAFYDSPLEEIGETAIQATLGAWRRMGQRGQIEFAFVEDLERQHGARRRLAGRRDVAVVAPRGARSALAASRRSVLLLAACDSARAPAPASAPRRAGELGCARPRPSIRGPSRRRPSTWPSRSSPRRRRRARRAARLCVRGVPQVSRGRGNADRTAPARRLRAPGRQPSRASTTRRRCAQSGLVWTPRSLEAWLADPAGFVAGTTMAFTGYRSAEDRRDLIAYLLRATQ